MISCSLTAIAQQLLRFREANCRVYGSLVAVILLEHSCFAIRCGECSFDLLLQYAARSAAARLAIIGESLDRIVAMSYRARCLLTGPLVVTHNAFQSKAKGSRVHELFIAASHHGVEVVSRVLLPELAQHQLLVARLDALHAALP